MQTRTTSSGFIFKVHYKKRKRLKKKKKKTCNVDSDGKRPFVFLPHRRQTDSRKDSQTTSATSYTLKPGLGLRCSMTEVLHHSVFFRPPSAVSSLLSFLFLFFPHELKHLHHTAVWLSESRNALKTVTQSKFRQNDKRMIIRI